MPHFPRDTGCAIPAFADVSLVEIGKWGPVVPEDGNSVPAESGAVDVRLDVPVARQVEDVDVGQEAVSGGVEGAGPSRVKIRYWLHA